MTKYKYIILAILLWGCGEKKKEGNIIQLACGDSTFWNTSWIEVYDGETLEDAVKRKDSTFGTNVFSLCYYSMKGDHSGICITRPDTCTTKLTDGVDLRGVGVPYFKQTIECDCSGNSYFPRDDNTWVAVDDSTKVRFTNGYIQPKTSNGIKIKSDTIYIYRDTCAEHRTLEYIPMPGILEDDNYDRTRMPIISFFDTSDQYKVNFPGDTTWKKKRKSIKNNKQ
jgi:hypothetical protein